jgi:hypothetical protein
VIVQNMKDRQKAYFMLLGKPWLKTSQSHHDCGNNVLTISSEDRVVTFNTTKRIKLDPSQQPKHLNDGYDGRKDCLMEMKKKFMKLYQNYG